MNKREALRLAPMKPACFPDQEQWAVYLMDCQEAKRPSSRPFERGQYRPAFNFCRDCTPEHQRQMQCAGKCNPQYLKATAPAAEPQGA